MISIRREPPVFVAGHEVMAIVRVSVTRHTQGDGSLFVSDKRPLAVVCKTKDSEHIFNMEGCVIDATDLDELMTVDGA